MKQRITVEQLQELTEEQQQKLREWWQPLKGDWITDAIDFNDWALVDTHGNADYVVQVIKKCVLPLLTTGQMIELLGDKLERIISPNSIINREPCNWQVWSKTGFFDKDNLCDALWDAVKGVL